MNLRVVVAYLTCLAIGYWPVCSAQDRHEPNRYSNSTTNVPQPLVICTGWHALCTDSTACQVNGMGANCDCMRVNETHIVETGEIQDQAVKLRTLRRCTMEHLCAVDEAPVCAAIKNAQYQVDNVKYRWVSTYSYRGWCTLLQRKLAACYPGTDGYKGDLNWAICDVAPCIENPDPADPNKPLSCQCRVKEGSFVGTNGTCTGDNGGIMSSMPTELWDFTNNTYAAPMPGNQYVRGACDPLKSDPPPQTNFVQR